MMALESATEPCGIELGSGGGMRWRKPSSPNPKKTTPSRTRATVGAWRAIALALRADSGIEESRAVAACMVISPFGVWVGLGLQGDDERLRAGSTAPCPFFREKR